MITSPRNPKIQFIRNLQSRSRARRKAQAFVIEGVRLAEEALAAAVLPQLVLHTENLSARGEAVLDGFSAQGAETLLVSPQVMRAASDTRTSQGLLAVLQIRPQPLPATFDFVLILDGVRDPGNLGNILRAALAFGVDFVILSSGTVDPYAPKVVRGATGAHFRLPFYALSWSTIRETLKNSFHPLQIFLADAHADQTYTQPDLRGPLALIVGSEAEGAGENARGLAPTGLRIPMPGGIESLNVAMAAGILMYEVVRQRGGGN